jgi:hypothetical protein
MKAYLNSEVAIGLRDGGFECCHDNDKGCQLWSILEHDDGCKQEDFLPK